MKELADQNLGQPVCKHELGCVTRILAGAQSERHVPGAEHQVEVFRVAGQTRVVARLTVVFLFRSDRWLNNSLIRREFDTLFLWLIFCWAGIVLDHPDIHIPIAKSRALASSKRDRLRRTVYLEKSKRL